MHMKYFSIVNLARCNVWHPLGIGSWSLSDWAVATVGEVGEACNNIKKMNRIRDGLIGNKPGETNETLRVKLRSELADAYIYLDLLAQAAGESLEDCVIEKFNEVNMRNNLPFMLGKDYPL